MKRRKEINRRRKSNKVSTQPVKLNEYSTITANEHWNLYAFEIICEVLQKGSFENPKKPNPFMKSML